ncbi:hypothetical protein LCGC14_2142990 [marine sediment metagenome]|uniref:Uncharacterized protein n=2 Tax=marine sediment metagenome TaxID=412755 RepID=A0A0F9DY31_9ZZZZ
MNRHEETQYAVSGIGVIEGADMDFKQPHESPCRDCGGMVDLTSEITFSVQNVDGPESESKMTEANARALLMMMGMDPPPVLCSQHYWVENPLVLPT